MRFAWLALLVACTSTDEPFEPFEPFEPPECQSVELPPITVPVGMAPTGLVGGNYIDGSSTSLVVANTGSNSIHVIRRTSGYFTFATTELATGAAPVAVALVNIEGDRDNDIVVANSGDDTVSIFRNRGWGSDVTHAGVATFDPPITIPVGRKPSAIARIYRQLGDNIAVANAADGTVTILVNDGQGSFTVGSTLVVGANPVAIVAKFLDRNLQQDLVVANRDDNTIGVLLNSGDDRTFGAMIPYATGMAPTAIAAHWQSTDDAVADIWVANAKSNDVSFFAHQGGGGYAPAVNTTTVGSPRGIIHDSYDRTFVADYDHGLIRLVGSPESPIAVGAHPNSLYVGGGTLGYAAANADAATVTIRAHDCI